MTAEAGLAALWLATALSLLQLALSFGLGGEPGRELRTVRAMALAQGLITIFAFGALIAIACSITQPRFIFSIAPSVIVFVGP